MTKFQLLSLAIHGVVLLLFCDFIKDETKFVQKKNMAISIVNKRGRTSNSQVLKSESKSLKGESEKRVEKVKQKEKIKSKKGIKKENKSKKSVKKRSEKNSEFQDKNRFIQGTDGVFTAIKTDGIEFEILKEVDPNYPIVAKKMGYSGEGRVTVKFLVDLNGNVKNIKIIGGESRFGFKEEVIKALKNWKFKPIVYKGKKIQANFEKTFIFNRK